MLHVVLHCHGCVCQYSMLNAFCMFYHVLLSYFIYCSRYGMFASLSHVLGTDMVPHLETIVNKMLESLRSSEGLKVKIKF